MNQKQLPCPDWLSTPIRPPVGLHQPLADAETQPSAAGPTGVARIELPELPEELGLVVRGNAWPGILDLAAQVLALDTGPDRDVSPFRELDGVGDQVGEHLLDPLRVC